jgi:hypothetical protein
VLSDDEYPTTALDAIEQTGVPHLLERWTGAETLVLERIARGGGATRWYVLRSRADLSTLASQLRPGSCVSFYFDDRFRGSVNDEVARAAILGVATEDGEAVVGNVSAEDIEVAVDFVGTAEDLDAWLSEHSGEAIRFGRFPGRENDGEHAVTFDLPDRDGVVRSHPH